MVYIINPVPDMEYQRLLGGYLPGLIDPTCGRYCLKSLLKYWYEKRQGGRRITRLTLDKPKSGWGDWIGFDAYDDYPHANEILVQTSVKPASAQAWVELLIAVGPVIICGDGVGTASSFVGHYILLVGIDPDQKNETFHFLDPLVGNEVRTAPWTMQQRIEPFLVYASADITEKLNRSHKYFTVDK